MAAAAAALCAAVLPAGAAAPLAAAVAVNVSARSAVPPTVIGVELEGVGHSIYGGGLYSQLVFDESFEDPRDTPGAAVDPDFPPHWVYLGSAAVSQQSPFHGKQSLALTCSSGGAGARCAGAANRGVHQRGIAVRGGKEYEGYIFLRNLQSTGPSSEVTVGLLGNATGVWANGTVLSSAVLVVRSQQWGQFNFSLTPKVDDPAASFFVALSGSSAEAAAVGVDMAFLEPGPWGRWEGMHLRRDVTERLLLDGALRSIRFDGSSVVLNPNFLWEHARGPAWLRPPRYGDCWYKYISNGFGIFEVMEIGERAGLDFVTVGMNVRSESPQSAADLVEYCFANQSTARGAQRAEDGHPNPYPPNVVFELGNEEGGGDYAAKALALLRAMEGRMDRVAPGNVGKVRYALAYNDWQAAAELADGAAAASSGGTDVVWDQHDLAMGLKDAPTAFQKHDAMIPFLRKHGLVSKQPMYIGETNCGISPQLCRSLNRALIYGQYTNLAARKGYAATVSPAVWAYSTCGADGRICGATDGKRDWPQGALIITPTGTVPQPPWYAHRMVGRNWGDQALRAEVSGGGEGGIVDVAVLANASAFTGGGALSVAVHAVSTHAASVNLSVALAGAVLCADQPGAFDLLSAPDLSADNSVARPDRVVPSTAALGLAGGRALLQLPPYALAVARLCIIPGGGPPEAPPGPRAE
eukprot:TRINITY_DN14034_c0_g1_i2.p1 TRINITY_DN14034_c0_g1~~TRINITY_DN14034_c0_g1_i2.p1  ORF type:complete len:718 (+),score=167.98 TRINITY_DN14034_c0_g1_i2:72-2156(+)